MNRTMRAVLAVVFIAIITFCAINISQHLFEGVRLDITDRKLYTLSDGTKSILARLNQPIKMKLYYTKTAAMKAPDQIRYFNNYYYFVESLLKQYVANSAGMVDLQVIDPRPFSKDEEDAIRYGLRRIPMSEEENFIFGMVVQTQFGVTKSIPLFSPDRQNFVEYDISYLIDSAIRRQKKTIAVLSSLPVMGEDLSPYMMRMMQMQGRRPQGPWTIIEQLREQYEVKKVPNDTREINDVDILLVVHPKDLPDKTLFAVDQFVLKGGRTLVFVDPHCFADQPNRQQMMMSQPPTGSSNLPKLMEKWGLKMPQTTFAGDRRFAEVLPWGSGRPQKVIGILKITPEGLNRDSAVTANLNELRVAFAGELRQIPVPDTNETGLERTPLISTTSRGNTWTVENPYELMTPDPQRLMQRFTDGVQPVRMGYLVTGEFESAFPQGVEIKDESDPNAEPEHISGLTTAEEDCAVAVFSDVDFITDSMAYHRSFFGKIPVGDNAALLMNVIDELSGSTDLISIRSRGSFTRPFTKVDRIEAEAEKSTLEQERAINAEIKSFQQELNKILSSAKQGQEEVIGSSIIQKKKELELKIHEAQSRLRNVKMKRREKIEQLGGRLRNLNTLPGPFVILLIAVVLGAYRSTKKRHYISHASDA